MNAICRSCATPTARACRLAAAASGAASAALVDGCSQATQRTQLNYEEDLPSTAAIAEFIEQERLTADEAAAASALLTLLRRVPATFAKPPRLWVPRQVRQQVAAALSRLLAAAAATADAAPGDVAAETAHLLCRAGPQLLLRYPPQTAEGEKDEAPDAANGPGVLQMHRARLLQARNGQWEALVHDLLADIEAPPSAVQRVPPSTRDAT